MVSCWSNSFILGLWLFSRFQMPKDLEGSIRSAESQLCLGIDLHLEDTIQTWDQRRYIVGNHGPKWVINFNATNAWGDTSHNVTFSAYFGTSYCELFWWTAQLVAILIPVRPRGVSPWAQMFGWHHARVQPTNAFGYLQEDRRNFVLEAQMGCSSGANRHAETFQKTNIEFSSTRNIGYCFCL